MGSTFDGISETKPDSNSDFRNIRLHNWITDTFFYSASSKCWRIGRIRRVFSNFIWKIIIFNLCLWLALVTSVCFIWNDMQQLRDKVDSWKMDKEDNLQRSNFVDEFVVFDETTNTDSFISSTVVVTESSNLEDQTSTTTPTSTSTEISTSSTTTGNPLADFQEIVQRKLDNSLDGLQAEILGRWRECRCPQGVKGDRGIDGPPGNCIKGEKGAPGRSGFKGSQGLQGERGDKGQKGEKGNRGQKGDRGLNGVSGPKGERGNSGPPGYDGEKGEKGEKGIKGERGSPGRVFGR